MEDLATSPFFDDRTITFISALLSSREPRPINATEQKLFEQAYLFRAANAELDRTLIAKLRTYKKHISVITSAQFIAGCQKRGILPLGIEILDAMVRDERGATLAELVTILKETDGIPAEWAVYTNARPTEDRHKKENTENRSKLNLDAMRDFR